MDKSERSTTEARQSVLNYELLQSVVAEANDAVLITKADPIEAPDGPEIIYVNHSFEKMTGYKADEVIGKTPRILQGKNSESDQLEKLRMAIRNRKSTTVEVLNYNKKGDEQWTHISISPIFDGDKCTHFISYQQDITERKIREIQEKITYQISQIFNEEETVEKALKSTLSEILKLKNFDAVEFWMVNRDSGSMKLLSYQIGNSLIADFYADEKNFSPIHKGKGLPGVAWKKKKNLFWRNLDSRKSFARNREAADSGMKTGLSFPVVHDDEVLGVLVILLTEDLKKEPNYLGLFEKLSLHISAEIIRKLLEERLKKIFALSPDIICLVNSEGQLKKINPAMANLLEYSEEELMSKPLIDFVHPDDVEISNLMRHKWEEGSSVLNFKSRFLTKSGKIKWFAWTSIPYIGEELVLAIGKDITEQKSLEDLLTQANRLAKIGSWELDLTSNELYWSDVTRQIHEVEPGFQPTLDKGITFYKDGIPREQIKKAVENAMQEGRPWDLELPIITAKGNERWIRAIGETEIAAGKPIRIFGSFQDIHVRKVAELKLQKRNRHIDAIAKLNSSLLNYENWFEALNNHLEIIGEAVQADRVYFFENRYDSETGEGYTSQKLEWCREGITSQLDNPDLEDIPFKDVPELVEPMIENRPSSESISSIAFGTTTRHVMEGQNIKTFLAIPIMIKGTFFGFVGFDNCTEEIKWSDEEVRTLTTITSNLAVAIERSQVEKDHMELQSEKNKILDSISDAFYAINRDWKITYFNSEAENLLGRKAEEVLGRVIWDVFTPAKETELYEFYYGVMNQGVSKTFEYYYPPFKSWYDISAYPAENGISVYFKNVNEKRETRKRILEKTRKLDAIAHFNGLLIKEEGWQEALDKCLERFCKVAAADRVYFFESSFIEESDQHVVSMKTEWVRDGIMPEIDNPAHHNLPIDNIRNFIDIMIIDGEFNEIVSNIEDKSFASFLARQDIQSILALPVYTGKDFRGFIGFDDCTNERNWSEEEITFLKTIAINLGSAIENEDSEKRLIQLNQSLEQQAKDLATTNADLEQFALMASHDLQEPLRMVTSFLAQLERKYDDILDEKGRKYIHFATDGAMRMRQIIRDLLEYSRVGRIDVKREEVDLNETLQNIVILQRNLIAEKGAEVNWEPLPTINANGGAVHQLFQNLIHNALHYQEKGNKPEVNITSEKTDNHWKFYVKDNGIGIDSKYTDQIFTIFQRLHGRDEYSGTGVGLAICKKIVEEHGGTIGFDSNEGHGSTFYFTIANDPEGLKDDQKKVM